MIKKISLSKIVNAILFFFVVWILAQKIPVFINMYQHQGNKILPVKVQTLSGDILSLPLPQKHLMVFWASWCGPCKIELSRINKLIIDGEINPNDVIAISIGENFETIKNHAKENDYRFIIGLDSSGEISKQYKVSGTPTLFLIDQNGVIEWMTMGLSPSLELRLKSFFKKP